MKTHTYKVRAESTGAFIVTAASPEQAEEIVLDHMERAGTPYRSAPHDVVQVCHEGADRVLSVEDERMPSLVGLVAQRGKAVINE